MITEGAMYKKHLEEKGDITDELQWCEFVEKKSASWKAGEIDWKITTHRRNVGTFLPRKSTS